MKNVFLEHVRGCPECYLSGLGICPLGFELLGEASGMREPGGQQIFEFAAVAQASPAIKVGNRYYRRKS